MLGKEKRVILTERLRLGNQVPLVIERSYLPYKEFKEILKMRLTGSLYHLLTKKFHVKLHRSIQTFRAIALSGKDARLLGVPPGPRGSFWKAPSMIRRISRWRSFMPIHRGDKYVFEVTSGRYRYDLGGLKKA